MSTPSFELTQLTALRGSARVPFGARLQALAERAIGVCLLILASPALGAVALLVLVLSRQSPFIAHRRVGQYGVEFWMLKIRTMWDRTSPSRSRGWVEHLADTDVPASKSTTDPRITSRFAVFCRRFSFDELPQLFHVVTGRMRLVGPRPITSAEWNTYYGDSAAPVLSVAPGITGLWQIKGRNRLTYPQRRRLDLFYARHRSLLFDLTILVRTPARVLSGRDAC
jgi:lipopolysaccharide/colanic/teichoic acid biosynthesis glycosyltransferase